MSRLHWPRLKHLLKLQVLGSDSRTSGTQESEYPRAHRGLRTANFISELHTCLVLRIMWELTESEYLREAHGLQQGCFSLVVKGGYPGDGPLALTLGPTSYYLCDLG